MLPVLPELPLLQGLAPLYQPNAKVLILGSMPGQASLDSQQYYGHPRNQLWPLLQQLFGVDASLDYPSRCQQALAAKVALWDVIGNCQRQGSLDSAIVGSSIRFNPLVELCQQLPDLQKIWLNGGKAVQSFRQYQRQQSTSWPDSTITVHELPSTSPAHASLTFAAKLELWRQALVSSNA
ncbi:DNA-deoxyinosine glycosylase [Rheinheimera riviphila]|uniref:DNA-deoxyinosine glycosylase n=2 Tax=Rheinheimera riviphila TaxID=1834037 RepID=A0A437R5N4_9GAMM|nr:DNA-deoxyinosine glycosylase [Rheinheimera riviphila]